MCPALFGMGRSRLEAARKLHKQDKKCKKAAVSDYLESVPRKKPIYWKGRLHSGKNLRMLSVRVWFIESNIPAPIPLQQVTSFPALPGEGPRKTRQCRPLFSGQCRLHRGSVSACNGAY